MDLNFTEEQEMLRKGARDFLAEKLPKKTLRQIEAGQDGYSRELWQEMAGLGWMGLPFPSEYGGSGFGFMDMAVLLEEMGRACLPGPYLSTVVSAGMAVLDFGNEQQQKEYLPHIASGQKVASAALIETDAAFLPQSIKTTAVREGNGWVLNGTKSLVPFGHAADWLVCLALTSKRVIAGRGLTAFLVDTRASGVRVESQPAMFGMVATVVLDKVGVPDSAVLGKVGTGWQIASRIMERSVAAVGCCLVGMLQQVFDMTVGYAKERKQFGRPIGSFQVVQHYCVDMFIELEALRLLSYQAAWKMGLGENAQTEVALARVQAATAGERILTLAHQIHAAMGVTMEYDLHYYTRAVKTALLAWGDADSCKEEVVRGRGL